MMTEYMARSWYGIPVIIDVERGFFHHVRVAGVSLDHPPLFNLILRRNLSEEARVSLSTLHELGHLQTLPMALIHLASLARGLNRRERKIRFVLSILMANQALWESMTELYVVLKSGEEYRPTYKKYPNRIGLARFWLGTTALSGYFSLKARETQLREV
jgi:hypothetical protein